MIERLTVTGEFVTIDLLLWRRFRTEVTGRVERTIALNRGICEYQFLPVGTVVEIEIAEAPPARVTPDVIRLWS